MHLMGGFFYGLPIFLLRSHSVLQENYRISERILGYFRFVAIICTDTHGNDKSRNNIKKSHLYTRILDIKIILINVSVCYCSLNVKPNSEDAIAGQLLT